MTSQTISPKMKSSLTDLARQLVDRSARARDAGAPAELKKDYDDSFSESGRLARLLELERRIEKTDREWSKTINTVLSTIERLESRVAQLDGELTGMKDEADMAEDRLRAHKKDLDDSARAVFDAASQSLNRTMERVEALFDEIGATRSQEKTRNGGISSMAGDA